MPSLLREKKEKKGGELKGDGVERERKEERWFLSHIKELKN